MGSGRPRPWSEGSSERRIAVALMWTARILMKLGYKGVAL
ncbi:hypothetical protein DB30_03815 [Enhygromyxa salina]|uniref:Uncharacterized protein n=1 Tax=Enhygromyxa salina TaxID=215803 RepID=A0A0C1ZP26_9BACT|nr:hypothetical protein DB30_03815 [Enhygromyxa salina]